MYWGGRGAVYGENSPGHMVKRFHRSTVSSAKSVYTYLLERVGTVRSVALAQLESGQKHVQQFLSKHLLRRCVRALPLTTSAAGQYIPELSTPEGISGVKVRL